MERKLVRSHTDEVIAGVCGGLGRYLAIDPVFVRLFFVLLALSGSGIGVIAYIVLWIIMPLEDPAAEGSEPGGTGDWQRNAQAGLIIGAALIVLGFVSLINALDLFWFEWLSFDRMWPLLLILGGGLLLWRHFKTAG